MSSRLIEVGQADVGETALLENRAAARPRRKGRQAANQLLPTWMNRGARLGLSVFIAIPVCYLLILSLSPEDAVDAGRLFPSHLILSNYAKAWTEVQLGRGFIDSAVMGGSAALIAVLVSTAAAYPLARYRFRGAAPLFYGTLGLQLVPGPMILLPLFVIYSMLRAVLDVTVVGSYWGLILTYIAFSLPLSMWLMVGYVRTIPRELDDAARVDGASGASIFWRVIVPLAVPGMVVAFVLSLLLGWNDVLFSSVLTTQTTRTAAVDIQLFTLTQNEEVVPLYAPLMAAGVMVAIPVVAVYMFLQRYLVGGLAGGAVK